MSSGERSSEKTPLPPTQHAVPMPLAHFAVPGYCTSVHRIVVVRQPSRVALVTLGTGLWGDPRDTDRGTGGQANTQRDRLGQTQTQKETRGSATVEFPLYVGKREKR